MALDQGVVGGDIKSYIFILFIISSFAEFLWAQSVSNVELQWVLCEKSASQFFEKIQVKDVLSQKRNVYYFETPSLDLFQKGAILRSRETRNVVKTVAKFNYSSESEINWDLIHGQDAKCEWDSYVGSPEKIGCSIKSSSDASSNSRWYSLAQEKFLSHETQIDFENLNIKKWGPAQSEEWVWDDLVLESVIGPNYYLSLELSTRVPLADKTLTQERIQTWLLQKNVKLCPQQMGHTGQLLKALMNQPGN